MRLQILILIFWFAIVPCSSVAAAGGGGGGPVTDIPESLSLAGRLEAHVAFLASDSLEGRGLGTGGKVLAKHYIARQFEDIGLKPAGEDFFQDFQLRQGVAWIPGTNVVGYLEGSDPLLKSEYIVIGAHYDHIGYEYRQGERIIFPGADDNASGTASLIEIARHLSRNRHLLGRSIIFIAFDAEESGLIGSQKFLEEPGKFHTDKIRLMFSLDMVGMYEDYGGLDLKGIGTMNGGKELARRLAPEHGIDLKNTSATIEFRTDTRPFSDMGIPSVHAFTGTGSPYHKPEDTWDLLDYEGMALVTRYLEALLSELSVMPEIGPSRRFIALQKPYALRFNAGVLGHAGGSKHIYADDFFRANTVFSFNSGFFAQVHIGKKISLQPEILYDWNGSRSAAGTFRRHSLTAPLNLQFNMVSEGGGLIRVYSLAGGYFRLSLSGKDGGVDLDLANHYPDREWGINLGFGADIMKVHVTWTMRRGLTNIFPGSDSASSDSRVLGSGHYFSVGYKF